MNDEVKESEPICTLGGPEADLEMRKAEGESVMSSASAAESAIGDSEALLSASADESSSAGSELEPEGQREEGIAASWAILCVP